MNSPLLIDIILVAVILFFCIMSYKRGLMLSIISAGSSIISFILSILLYPVVSNILKATPLVETLKKPVHESIMKISSGLATTTTGEVVKAMDIPEVFKENILNQVSNADTKPFGAGMADSLTSVVTGLIIDVIAIIILFLVVRIIILFLKKGIKGVGSIPVIKQVDRAGGLVFGLIEAFIVITVIAAVFSYFSANIASESFMKAINESIIGNYFYNDNLILNIISGKPLSIPEFK